MLDRPLAAFDLETVPDPDAGRRLQGLSGTDAEVLAEMQRLRLEETGGRTDFPPLPLHRIVAVAAARLDPASGRFELGTLGGDAWDERSHLEGFLSLFTETPPRLVSWNGSGFDLPVIRYRGMLHGIPAPALYRTDGEWEQNHYHHRHHDMHVDLMDVLSGHGASSRVSLRLLAQLLGLPVKSFLEEGVLDHVLRGEIDLVREYCKLDVLATLLLYLNWALHRGALAAARLQEYVATIAAALRHERHPGWEEIRGTLADWRPGMG